MAKHRARNPWWNSLRAARDRCRQPTHPSWSWYGAKGIQCHLTPEEAKALWARDQGAKLKRPSLDRIDSDGDYTFANCRFIELSKNTSAPHFVGRTPRGGT